MMDMMTVVFTDQFDDLMYRGDLIYEGKIYLTNCTIIDPESVEHTDIIIYGGDRYGNSICDISVIGVHKEFLEKCGREHRNFIALISSEKPN